MGQYAGGVSSHTKRRGKTRACEWCGQRIEIGEKYATWLWFDDGTRATVYSHAECWEAWVEAASETYERSYAPMMSEERPKIKQEKETTND